ncbi:unnamed protein product [Ilex paraguariensis]|uniref:Uncharacterized protein n=1 Tax=Ilex paraguariensis TaxID=185542 RepID=A0ABC8RFQ5_9AQUA
MDECCEKKGGSGSTCLAESYKLLSIGFLILILLCLQQCKASRMLDGEEQEWVKKGDTDVLQSLQRGPVPPSGPSGCTNIPGSGGPNCPIKQMNFAGVALPRASAYPRLVAPFGATTTNNQE